MKHLVWLARAAARRLAWLARAAVRFDVAVVVLLAALYAGSTTEAQEPERAPSTPTESSSERGDSEPGSTDYQRIVAEALSEYGLGHYEEARTLFQRAHALAPSARTERGLGMVEFELRHYVAARRLFELSLKDARKPLSDDQRQSLERLLERTNAFIATYELSVEPARQGLVMELDGAPVTLEENNRLSLDPGDHVLRISAPEAAPKELHIDVKGGENQTLHITLELKHGDRLGRVPAPAAAVRASDKPPRRFPRLGVALIATGGAIAVTGGVFGGIALERAGNTARPKGDEADRAVRFGITADVTISVGLASAVCGLVLVMLREKRPVRAGPRVQVESVWPTFGGTF